MMTEEIRNRGYYRHLNARLYEGLQLAHVQTLTHNLAALKNNVNGASSQRRETVTNTAGLWSAADALHGNQRHVRTFGQC